MTERFTWPAIPSGMDVVSVLNTRIPRVARSLNAILQGTISSELGDGITDQYFVIQGELDTIAANGGGVLTFGPGIFITSRQLHIPSNTKVVGSGRSITTIKRANNSLHDTDSNNTGSVFATGPTASTFYTPSAPGVHIELHDLAIDGNFSHNTLTSNDVGAHGFRADYTDYLHATNVALSNCMGSGLYLFGCEISTWLDCYAASNGQLGGAGSKNGFTVTGPQDDSVNREVQDEHVFVGCRALSNGNAGFVAARNGHIILDACISSGNIDKGVEGDSGTSTSDTSNVPAGWTIVGCNIYSNQAQGISLSNINLQRLVVMDNLLEDNAKAGIAVSQVSGALCAISDNLIRNWGTASSGDHGIVVGAGFDQVVVADNQVCAASGSGTLGAGIVLIAQSSTRIVSITGNQVVNAGAGGLSLTGALRGRIAGNTVVTTGTAGTDGITVSGGANGVDNLDVDDNFVYGATRYGILLSLNGAGNMTNVRVRRNTATNQTFGLAVVASSTGTLTNAIVDRNDFRGNSSGTITGLTAAMVAGFDTAPLVSADRGDADVTLNAGTDEPTQIFATALTGNHVVTLNTGFKGAKFRVVRTGLGNFTLSIGGLKTLVSAVAAFADVEHTGAAWTLTGYGTL